MRGISSGITLVTVVLLFIEIVAFWGLFQLMDRKDRKWKMSFLYWTTGLVCFGLFLYAFLDPGKIRHTVNYGFYYFVIFCLMLNFFPKALLSFFVLLSLPVRLLRNKRDSLTVILSGIILSTGVFISILSGFIAGKKLIRQEEVKLVVPSLPETLNGIKIVHISDFHLSGFSNTRFMERLAERVNRQKPDLILFTGDMVNNFHQEIRGFESVLGRMEAHSGKLAILGNHDYGDYSEWDSPADKASNLQAVKAGIQKCGFRLLLNESQKINFRDTSFYVVGVENWGHPPFPQYARLDSALAHVSDHSFRILLSHDPAHWEDQVLRQRDIPLTLSGHSHGGQFGIKIAGLEFSLIWLISRRWGGLYEENGQYLYVNRGAGCVGFPARLDMSPEITVITLLSTENHSVTADQN